MKVYKTVNYVGFDNRSNIDSKLQKSIADVIEQNQNNGLQSEVQYSTCATNNTVVFSALILGYTEE